MGLHPDLQRGLRALSIIQPWSWLIANGHKDIENRDWPTRFRGEVLIHAGQKLDKDVADDLWRGVHPVTGEPVQILDPMAPPFDRGGIVGICEIVDCVTESTSPWFVGARGFVIRNARPLPFTPCKGALGFFTPTFAMEAAHGSA
ncbi:ASCH domain-containing protein [Phreatobacter sp. HK31-P]